MKNELVNQIVSELEKGVGEVDAKAVSISSSPWENVVVVEVVLSSGRHQALYSSVSSEYLTDFVCVSNPKEAK